MLTQVKMLGAREISNLCRDTTALASRFGLSIFLGVLIGVIFLDVGGTDRSVDVNVNSIFGALVIILLQGMFGTAQPALLAFPEERPVFLREYSTNHYSVVSYFISRLAMEAFITAGQSFVIVSRLMMMTLICLMRQTKISHLVPFFCRCYQVHHYLLHGWTPTSFWHFL
jgi:uncharacterized transporter YbjL